MSLGQFQPLWTDTNKQDIAMHAIYTYTNHARSSTQPCPSVIIAGTTDDYYTTPIRSHILLKFGMDVKVYQKTFVGCVFANPNCLSDYCKGYKRLLLSCKPCSACSSTLSQCLPLMTYCMCNKISSDKGGPVMKIDQGFY